MACYPVEFPAVFHCHCIEVLVPVVLRVLVWESFVQGTKRFHFVSIIIQVLIGADLPALYIGYYPT